MTKIKWGKDISRRSFVGLAAVAASTLALSSQSWPSAFAEDHNAGSIPTSVGDGQTVRIRTMCRGCGKMECSSWVTVENGRAIKIEGDESNMSSSGNCCSKSQASLQACYHPDRLRYPLKRTNPKGDDDPGWVRTTWDEALSTAGKEFNRIISSYGVNSNMTMGGTSRLYCMSSCAGLQGILDTVNTYQAYQICKGPRHLATAFQSNRAFSWMATVDRPRVLVVWGGGAEISNYDDSCRTMVDAATKADVYITVDPRMSNLGKEADIWLPLRPGTDAAMALGWLNVIVNKNLYNEMWVKRWTDLPYLVAEDMHPTSGPGTPESPTVWDGTPVQTKLLKQSDLQEDGDPNKFMVWDKIGKRLVWHDCITGYWEGEEPYLEAVYGKPGAGRKLPGQEAKQPNLFPGVPQGYVPDMSDFSHCNPVIDPDYEVEPFEVTLKDGSKVTVRPAWSYFIEHLSHYSPEVVAEITEVPAELIEKAATTYATPIDPTTGYGNGGIQYMLAIEHSANSIQCCRAIDAIVGLTNNFDTPGGNRGGTVGVFNTGQYDMGVQWMLNIFGFESVPPLAPLLPSWVSDSGEVITYDYDHKYEAWSTIAGIKDIPMLAQGSMWGDSTAIWDCCNRSSRAQYPIYGGVCQSGDVMNMSNSLWGWEGLKQLDFFLDLDLWHTPTSQLADYLLPVRHWLEVDCPRTSQGSNGSEGSHCRTVEPLAETWFDIDIIIQLCKARGIPWHNGVDQIMGTAPADAAPDVATDAEKWPDSIYDLNYFVSFKTDPYGANYKELVEDYPGDGYWEKWKNYFQEQGMQDCKVICPDGWGTYRRYETGCDLPNPAGFYQTNGRLGLNTPTRKQEIWSTLIETHHKAENTLKDSDTLFAYGIKDTIKDKALGVSGYGEKMKAASLYGQDIAGFSRPDEKSLELITKVGPFTLPTFTEPPLSKNANPEYAKEHPFIMTTGRRIPVYFHSEHRQLPWCRELWPVPRVEINPSDAAELGIKQGDWVWIETDLSENQAAETGVKTHAIRQVADLYYGIRPGTINCEHQWWMPEFHDAMKGYDLIGVNTLNNKDLRDPICGSPYVRAVNVKVYKATPENSPNGNVVPVDPTTGKEMISTPQDPRLKEWLPVYDRKDETGTDMVRYAERNKVQL
jgi:anaerobic selenocysteine-containing dehydrogenase